MCRLCGAVGDVDCAVGHTPCLTAANDLGFDIDEAEVVYWGRCPTCQASGESATRLDPKTDRRKNVRNIDSKKK
jgi:Fur family ferric uptake transcriptional regulator